MTTLDWLDCTTYLQDEWPSLTQKLTRPRWKARFGHLPKERFLRAVDTYANEHSTAPTVNALAACLHTSDHVHAFEDYLGAIWCNTCGTHGPNCECRHCQCPHEFLRDGQYSSQHTWLRCVRCAGTRVGEEG